MLTLHTVRQSIIYIFLFFILTISQVFAAATNCRPSAELGGYIDIDIGFEIDKNTTSITPGTTLATKQSNLIALRCDFTGDNNPIYFKSAMPSSIKNMLNESGVDIFQLYNVGGNVNQNITQPTVPDIFLGVWKQPSVGLDVGFIIRYEFTVKKSYAPLKPFDTGVFFLGFHVNEQGTNIGAPIYARFVGNLTLLCPTPRVNIVASNGGRVDFGTLVPKNLYDGNAVSKNFNLNMAVTPDCETGLNISVRFEPNNNTVLDNKNLDMGNGLQMLLRNTNGDINYNEPYFIGELLPLTPVNLPYSATLSHIPGRNIASGPFSKTIKVVVSY